MTLTSWAVGYRGALVRWVLLAVTLLVLGYFVVYARAFGISPPDVPYPEGAVAYVLRQLLVIGTTMALMAIYILDVVANPRLGWTARTVWIVALALGIVLAMPIYWALYLRRKHLSPGLESSWRVRESH